MRMGTRTIQTDSYPSMNTSQSQLTPQTRL